MQTPKTASPGAVRQPKEDVPTIATVVFEAATRVRALAEIGLAQTGSPFELVLPCGIGARREVGGVIIRGPEGPPLTLHSEELCEIAGLFLAAAAIQSKIEEESPL